MSKHTFTYDLKKFWMYSLGIELIFAFLHISIMFTLGFFESKVEVENQLLFEYPNAFYLLILLPIFYFLQIRALSRRNKMVSSLARPDLQSFLFKPVNTRRIVVQFLLFKLVLVYLIFGLASPIFGKKKQNTNASSLELVICLDVSNSMNTNDVEGVSRLEASKRALGQLVNKLTGERIGICVFAGSAFVQLPLTMDYHAAKLFVQEIETDMVSSQGTNINEALKVSNEMFTKLNTSKGIFMLTDGEDHVGLEDSIIAVLRDKKVEISILGIGSEKGGPVPIDTKRPGLGYKKTTDGRQVISKLNQDFIKSLAEQLNGNASVTKQAFPNVNEVLTEINQMKKGNSRNLELEISEAWYQVPLFMAFLSFIGLFMYSNFTFQKK
jgi:Ca-activated chloride channel family protein